MKYSVFILSHQDDEIGVFEIIRQALKNNEKIYIFYMTNGAIKKQIPKNKLYYRDKESLSVLKKFGLKRKNIIFFGRENNIPTCLLYKKMNIAFNKLKKFFNTLSGDTKIYTHAWEGGNEDHDACNILIKCILYKSKRKLKCFQFPLYNANSKIFYYQVQKTLKENGKIRKIKANFYNRMKYIKYLFFYKSQLRVWVGLYPFLITNLIFKQSIQIQDLNKNIKFKKPHKGLLLYEKFKRCNYKDFKQTIDLFLNKYIYN